MGKYRISCKSIWLFISAANFNDAHTINYSAACADHRNYGISFSGSVCSQSSGGVVGACTAYFLSQCEGIRVTVIEKTNVACGASGKAGGFLAYNWSDDTMIGDISRQSFKLHAELANKLDGHMKYGYRSVDTYSVLFKTGESQKSSSNAVSWIDPAGVCRVEKIGSTKDTAQVHPRLFTETVLEAAKATGVVTLQSGVGVSHLIIKDKTAVGVQLDNNQVVDADGVIVSMGPWSGQLPILDLPIEGRRAHSIVFRPSQSVPAQALFTAILDGTRSHEPEVYPRPDGTVYMCGATDNEPLPASGGDVQVSSKAIEQLEQLRDMLAPELYGGETIAQQACYLPISRDGSPLVGHHPTYKHLYIATGHSCWGILQAPSTGKMIAELVANGRISCVDKEAVEAVDPKNRC